MGVDTVTTGSSLNAHANDLRYHGKRISRLEAVIAGIIIYEAVKIAMVVLIALVRA